MSRSRQFAVLAMALAILLLNTAGVTERPKWRLLELNATPVVHASGQVTLDLTLSNHGVIAVDIASSPWSTASKSNIVLCRNGELVDDYQVAICLSGNAGGSLEPQHSLRGSIAFSDLAPGDYDLVALMTFTYWAERPTYSEGPGPLPTMKTPGRKMHLALPVSHITFQVPPPVSS